MTPKLVEEKKAKKECSNFSACEKNALISFVEKYKSIIECKRTDAVSTKLKLQAWNQICLEFNAKALSADHRPADKLKLCWDNLKRNTRKHFSHLRREPFKTGGGRNPMKENLLALRVKEIIGNTVEPMDNEFDDDAPEDKSDQVTGSFGQEWEELDVTLDESEPITEENVSLPSENSIQVCIETEEEASSSNKILNNQEIETEDWSAWNPEMLKEKKSSILEMSSTSSQLRSIASGSKSPQNEENVAEQVTEHERLEKIVIKRLVKKPYNKRRQNKRSEEYTDLIYSKIDYIQTLKREAVEKCALEKQILQNTLLEQQLKIELLRKQIEKEKSA